MASDAAAAAAARRRLQRRLRKRCGKKARDGRGAGALAAEGAGGKRRDGVAGHVVQGQQEVALGRGSRNAAVGRQRGVELRVDEAAAERLDGGAHRAGEGVGRLAVLAGGGPGAGANAVSRSQGARGREEC